MARKRTFIETQCTPAEATNDWRDDLDQELDAQSVSYRERLQSLFVKACSDLEDRCNDVEQPLREGKENLSTLQGKYDDLRAAHAALEMESVDRNVQLDALEAERDHAQAELQAVRDDNQVLSSRIQDLQHKVKDAESEADQRVKECQRALEKADMAHAAESASMEEELEDAHEAVQTLQHQLRDKDTDVATAQTALQDAVSSLEAARESIRSLEQSKKEQQHALQTLAEERQAAVQSADRVESSCSALLAQRDEDNDAHKAEVASILEQAKIELASQKEAYEEQLAHVSNDHTLAIEEMRSKLAEAESNALQAKENHVKVLQNCEAELGESQKKLERLQRKYEQKAQQLASATAMQQNIAAAMGLRNVQPQPMTLPRRSLRGSTARSLHHHEEDESQDPSPPTPYSGDDFETQAPQQHRTANDSVSELDLPSGPTPKRPRSRKAFKIPSPANPQTRLSTASRSTRASLRAQSTGNRRPLMNVGVNCQSPAMVKGAKTPGKGGMDDLDDTTWDGSELFAGTQF